MMKAYSAKDLWTYEDMLYTLQSALNTAEVYEVFTKDEVIAILTEIQLEIEELDPSGNEWSDSLDACNEIIQQKINALKAESEDKE